MKYAVYEVRQHDDVRRLAQTLLGDLHRWRELVTLNRLEYPYLADAPVPGARVLVPGDQLFYPSEGAVLAPQSAPDAEAEAYGRDLALVGGTLVLQGQSYALVSGVANLRGALERRLNTPLGGLPAHPETYGHTAKQYLGRVTGPEEVALVGLEFERCARQDARASAVTAKPAYDGRRVVEVDLGVQPTRPGESATVRASF